jgi:hypothetical protein
VPPQGVSIGAWDLVSCIASFTGRGGLIAFFGVVDLTLAMPLLVGIAYQGKFLPGTYASCGDAGNWHNGVDGANYFLTAINSGAFGDRYASAHAMCHDLVQNWASMIAVA